MSPRVTTVLYAFNGIATMWRVHSTEAFTLSYLYSYVTIKKKNPDLRVLTEILALESITSVSHLSTFEVDDT